MNKSVSQNFTADAIISTADEHTSNDDLSSRLPV